MILFIPVVILAIIGWLIKYKKVTWLISGYNTASKQEKEKYDIEKLCKHMGNFIFALAFILLIMALAYISLPEYSDIVIWIGLATEAVAITGGIIYMNTGNRVKKD